MELIKQYRQWFEQRKEEYGSRWHESGFLFFSERSGQEGEPMNPDSITRYLDKFSRDKGLPHINPHAFRHTMASVLCFSKVDPVSISRRLGHSRVSTTTDIYSHMLKEADEVSAEQLAEVMLRRKNIKATTKAG
jgi:integrase